MEFLRLLEKIRNPFLDGFFSIVTFLGGEIAFLAIAITIFWCVNKREGFYVLITGLIGTIANQALKLVFKVPRPWKDPTFTAVESAIPEATGYSFPSGHTQNVTGTFGAIAMYSKRKWVKNLSLVTIVLVAFSRMYLGVHTPLDVGFSLMLGAFLVLLLHPIFENQKNFDKYMPYVIGASVVMAIGLVIYVFVIPKGEVDGENLESGIKNSASLLGCTLGLIPAYVLDRKYIKFDTDAKWYAQILKLVFGLAIVIGLKEGLKIPFAYIFTNVYVARTVRYFTVVIFAGVVWPMTFKFFKRLRIGALDRLFSKGEK